MRRNSKSAQARRPTAQRDDLYFAKLEALRAAIDQGLASGIAKGDAFARVRNALSVEASSLTRQVYARKPAILSVRNKKTETVRLH